MVKYKSFQKKKSGDIFSFRTTLTSTTSSAMLYSDEVEELEEKLEEPIGANMTDLDVRKETEAFLEDNKLRRANIRF